MCFFFIFPIIHLDRLANANSIPSSKPNHLDQDEHGQQQQLPSFEWDKEYHDKHKGLMEKLKIHFPDGGPDDYALLVHINPLEDVPEEDHPELKPEEILECNLSGYLQDDTAVVVTVSGCPQENTFELKMFIHFSLLIIISIVHCAFFQILLNSQRLHHHAFSVVDGVVTALKVNTDPALPHIDVAEPMTLDQLKKIGFDTSQNHDNEETSLQSRSSSFPPILK